jgi:LmbE family N-acetylglucosaminyl deacetylase
MMNYQFAAKKGQTLKILCLGAHSDDIEIGCGGTILRLLNDYKGASAYWVVFSANAERQAEAEKSARLFLGKAAGKNIVIKGFRESYFPYTGEKIKEYFESLKKEFRPDIIFTHYRHDLHQDHRIISELTWNTFRDHLILEYEVMKYDGDLGSPNLFVGLSGPLCRRKIKTITNCFKSQCSRQWFSEDVFYSLLRLRGVESNSPSKYAEAFYCRKMVFAK